MCRMMSLALSIFALSSGCAGAAAPALEDTSTTTTSGGCSSSKPGWIWCDDFEQDRTSSYFEYARANNSFTRAAGVGRDGSFGMRAHFNAGQVDAGSLKLAVGKTPGGYFRPADAGTAVYRELYWRVFVRNQPGWVGGGGNKLSRATSIVAGDWSQAMFAHVWSGSSPNENYLVLDPASGTDGAGHIATVGYNDFAHMRWLGAVRGQLPLFDASHVGVWRCIEAHVRLNDAGQANGVFELWIDGQLDARKTSLDFVENYSTYGVNAVFLESYWNDGSPQQQERYFDDFVVSTQPIGC